MGTNDDINAYFKDLSKKDSWGDQNVFIAASAIYNINITVHQLFIDSDQLSPPYLYSAENSQKILPYLEPKNLDLSEIHLGYIDSPGHYVLLEKKNRGPGASLPAAFSQWDEVKGEWVKGSDSDEPVPTAPSITGGNNSFEN